MGHGCFHVVLNGCEIATIQDAGCTGRPEEQGIRVVWVPLYEFIQLGERRSHFVFIQMPDDFKQFTVGLGRLGDLLGLPG
jgi:hypothetical protein